MAIEKSKTLLSGVTGNYWRVTSITIDRQNKFCIGRIGLFKDKATSDAGGIPLGAVKSFQFAFTLSELAAATNIIAFAYSKIVAYAEEEISYDINGNLLDTPVPRDPDIAGGVMV